MVDSAVEVALFFAYTGHEVRFFFTADWQFHSRTQSELFVDDDV